MEFSIGMTVKMKKPHPCKNDIFIVTRIGMDIKLKCQKCGREIMLSRAAAEKAVKKIIE